MTIATLPTTSAGKSAKGASELSPALAREVRAQFGDEAIVSARDERLANPSQLGPSWKEIDGSYILDNGGDTRQVLTRDAAEGKTTLSTIHYVSMTRTESETLTIDRQGKVRKETSIAH